MNCLYEVKTTGFEDDISIITNGTPQSYDGILRVLDSFAQVSALRINFTKQKWFGSVVKNFQEMYFTTHYGN